MEEGEFDGGVFGGLKADCRQREAELKTRPFERGEF